MFDCNNTPEGTFLYQVDEADVFLGYGDGIETIKLIAANFGRDWEEILAYVLTDGGFVDNNTISIRAGQMIPIPNPPPSAYILPCGDNAVTFEGLTNYPNSLVLCENEVPIEHLADTDTYVILNRETYQRREVRLRWEAVTTPYGDTLELPSLSEGEYITHFNNLTYTYSIREACTGTIRQAQVWVDPQINDNPQDRRQVAFRADYAIRTIDDALIQLWIMECGETVENYTRAQGEYCFRQYFSNAIYLALQSWTYSGRDSLMAITGASTIIDTDTLSEWEAIYVRFNGGVTGDLQTHGMLPIILSQDTIFARLEDLSLQTIVNLYTALLNPVSDYDGLIYPDESDIEEELSFSEALQIAFVWEAGGVGDYTGFQEDLATDDWLDLNPRYSTPEYLFERLVDLIENAAYIGIFFDRFTYPNVIQSDAATFNSRYFDDFSRSQAESVLRSYLNVPDEPTEAYYLKLIQLGMELANEFNAKAGEITLSDDPMGSTEDVVRSHAYAASDGLIRYGEGYEDRITLDNLRATIFNTAWNPTTELEQLTTLRTLIMEMPAEILEVDVTFAKTGMTVYADMLQAQIDWRNQMRVHLINIDQEMLRRQEQGIPWQTLWWLGEFALAFLFEPIDWLITIRDIASGIYHGDLSLWDFVGFLPIITNNLGDIARLMARSGVDEFVEEGVQRLDDIDIYVGRNPIKSKYHTNIPDPDNWMVNQEWSMSCVPGACRHMLHEIGVDVDEDLLRISLDTDPTYGTSLNFPNIVEALDEMVEGTPLQGVATFRGGVVQGNFTPTLVDQMINHHDVIMVVLGDGKPEHAVRLLSIDLNTNLVSVLDPYGVSGPGSGVGSLATITWDNFMQIWRGHVITADI